MRQSNLIFAVAALLTIFGAPLAANANQFKLPEEIGRIEGARDLNLIQVEPSVINERYYTTGRCERRQFVGNVLPDGADIPDSDPAPIKPSVKSIPVKTVAPQMVPATVPAK